MAHRGQRLFALVGPNLWPGRPGNAQQGRCNGFRLDERQPAGTPHSQDFYVYSTDQQRFCRSGQLCAVTATQRHFLWVQGARIFTNDGRSHFYDATQLHHDAGFRNWDVAIGETIKGFPRVIRWHIRYNVAGCPPAQINLQAFYRNAGATVSAGSASVPFPCQLPTQQSKIFLPFIIK
ncbi:MAG: hypothetical protein U0401_03500 [Anaerolineae bacterium]